MIWQSMTRATTVKGQVTSVGKGSAACIDVVGLPLTSTFILSLGRRYVRKRKRYTNSISPSPRDAQQLTQHGIQSASPLRQQTTSPSANDVSVLAPTPGDLRTEGQPQWGTVEPVPHPQNTPKSLGEEETYMGREEYLPGSVPGDKNETPAHANPASSSADKEMLRPQNAFQLPPKVVRDGLVDSFMQFCDPWTPIVEQDWLDEEQSPSPLLLQAVFLAGSRVSSAPLVYASSEEFYRRAKLLFFFGSEGNPLISVVAATLLQWYNPVGPETISTDTSGFWIRTAGAIAFQMGLHKELPPHARNRTLRRRLWWTLVVRVQAQLRFSSFLPIIWNFYLI